MDRYIITGNIKRRVYRRPKADEITRFWSKVDIRGADQCWLWKAGIFKPYGYGAFYFDGKNTHASRFAFMATNGPIPDEMTCVCHKCDNPLCCNPNHLFLGTMDDNVKDCVKKGRNDCPRGETHALAVLTWDKVKEIRQRYIPWVVSQYQLAKEYGVSRSQIERVVAHQDWKQEPNGVMH